jgi:uncharacterized protein (TIGR00251 family)
MNVTIVARFQRVRPFISRSSSNSNRHFAVRLKNAVNSSKQKTAHRSNRNISDPLRAKNAGTAPHRGLQMEIKESSGTVSFSVRVSPRASRDAIEGQQAGSLKVRLTAPPVDDRANDSLRRLLAKRLAVPLSAVRIVAGEKSRTKRIAISGLTRGQLLALLQPKNLQRAPLGEKD